MLKQPSLKQALNALFAKKSAVKAPTAESPLDIGSTEGGSVKGGSVKGGSVDSSLANDSMAVVATVETTIAGPKFSKTALLDPAPASDEPVPTVDSPVPTVDKNTEAETETSTPVKKKRGLPKRKLAIVLALFGAGSGLAFTQAAPALQEAMTPDPANIPLRRANDPVAEPLLETQDLFLTNEIFYRKIEAIAQVPRKQTALGDPLQKGTAATSNQTGNQTGASTTPSTAAAIQAAAAQQAEQVKADAPPAPKATAAVFEGTTIDSVLEMRVAVAKDVSAIAFATSGKGTVTDLDGNVLKTLPAETSALAEIGNGIVVEGTPMPTAFWVYPEDGGYVAVGDSWYRGRVLIALRERGLIAVNYVFLGDYLYSVVGSEMSPDWAIESLKAQAVAARSYALTHNIHPASEEYFDLDNTQRFQAYKGIDREANTTQSAVQATAGEFISHEGGIVESLYAASQAIVDDAHKGSGMSQLGARDLADQGYSYTEILSHYYPGTALGRLETDPH